MTILSGRQAAKSLLEDLQIRTKARVQKGLRPPHLAAILVGEDGASQTYVNNKIKTCEKIGFESTLIRLENTISQSELIHEIHALNESPEIDGYIVQLPLPDHIEEGNVLQEVDPEKDVDGFHPVNTGRMVKGLPSYVSATPLGILKLLEHYSIDTNGKHCVVLGRSNIVGSPMSILMARNSYPGNATVTLCHSRTKHLKVLTLQADILIAALGKPEFVGKDMVKKGAVVIDVGTTRVKDDSERGWTLKGDVAFDEVEPIASAITPVPGGVGPMTIAALMHNTYLAAEKAVYHQNQADL